MAGRDESMMQRLRKFFVLLLAVLPLSYCTTVSQEETVATWYKNQEPFIEELREQNADLIAEARKAKISEPFFWRVSKAGKESWLFGTIHQGVSIDALPWRVHQEIDEASRFLFESDMEDPKEQLFDKMFRESFERGHSLKAQLDPRAWEVLTSDLAPFPGEALDVLEPKHAYLLYTQFLTQTFFLSKDYMDFQIFQKAKDHKKSWGFLETIDEIDLVVVFTEKTTPEELNKFLLHEPKKEISKEVAKLYRMILIYKRGNLDSLEKFFEEEGGGDVYQSLVSERNIRWMKKLKKEMAGGGRFVAVGAGHMMGKASLLKMLEKEGFKVERWTSRAAF
jgi:uncharacterized protein YbaP (TraB family)